MSITIEIREPERQLLLLHNISKVKKKEPNPPKSLPKDDDEKEEKMNNRLRVLVNEKWNQKKIRLIAWNEEEKRWYMWTKAQDSKDP